MSEMLVFFFSYGMSLFSLIAMQLNAEPVPQEPGTSRAPLSRKVSACYAASEGPGGVLR